MTNKALTVKTMKREIKFRGKRKDKNLWIYGYYSEIEFCDGNGRGSYIKMDGYTPIEVITETVGQFTGLTDKNGKEIYEGDIVKVNIERADFVTLVTWGRNSKGWKLKCDRTNIDKWGTIKYYSLPASDRIEIIGNIHDKPDLLNI